MSEAFAMTSDGLTTDDFLGGALRLRQPVRGLRGGADGVLLAAAVRASVGMKVLDVGTGVGVVALCLARRQPDLDVDGLEIQPDLAALARENVKLNGMEQRVRILEGDLAQPPDAIAPNSYDMVVSNPPYFAADRSMASPKKERATGRTEGALDLAGWVRCCLRLVKPRGSLCVIFRAERLASLLATLQGRAGDILVYPLWPRQGQAAKLVIVTARKGSRGALTLHPGLVLHDATGAYSEAAEAILRGGAALPI
ncbi:MAG: methyltransferase domain-containing protein [Alphaproteobacteria bacterium]|nr:MAG: methyltransferase domain-containing protein [Alphaproteobacteria bacterium]